MPDFSRITLIARESPMMESKAKPYLELQATNVEVNILRQETPSEIDLARYQGKCFPDANICSVLYPGGDFPNHPPDHPSSGYTQDTASAECHATLRHPAPRLLVLVPNSRGYPLVLPGVSWMYPRGIPRVSWAIPQGPNLKPKRK